MACPALGIVTDSSAWLSALALNKPPVVSNVPGRLDKPGT